VNGRVWYFGHNTFYGFATDGPLFTNSDGGKHSVSVRDATLLRTMGDGNTQGARSVVGRPHVVAPVFSGATSTAQFTPAFESFRDFGMWSAMNDGLHVTIYDKHYMVTTGMDDPHGGPVTGTISRSAQAARHRFDYPLDAQGRRLVDVVLRDPSGTFSGNFYVAQDDFTGGWIHNNSGTENLPAGVTSETSVPAVRQSERGWIGLSVDLDTFDYTGNHLRELPFMTTIAA
jgi:hypothetical protein